MLPKTGEALLEGQTSAERHVHCARGWWRFEMLWLRVDRWAVFMAVVVVVLLPVSDTRAAAETEGFAGAGELPTHEWINHDGKHWQVVSAFSEDPAVTDLVENNRGSCRTGMVEVRGRMKVEPGPNYFDAMQKAMCTRWIDEEFPERCASFDGERWRSFIAPFATTPMAFCIDRYEYPNAKGQFPWILVSWREASQICSAAGKRLCAESEWTFACEGEEAWPYPYGYTRSPEVCVIDRPWQAYDDRAFWDRSSRTAMLELDRLWQGEASGSRSACRSPFGVYDMTGNVDEWTQSVSTQGHRSILKGGYWAQVRSRCRPSTRVHDEDFAFYQQGFRCCADAPR